MDRPLDFTKRARDQFRAGILHVQFHRHGSRLSIDTVRDSGYRNVERPSGECGHGEIHLRSFGNACRVIFGNVERVDFRSNCKLGSKNQLRVCVSTEYVLREQCHSWKGFRPFNFFMRPMISPLGVNVEPSQFALAAPMGGVLLPRHKS